MVASASIQSQLGLRTPPIAIAFLDRPPEGLTRWGDGEVPAGCTFWSKAMAGAAFYTVAEDHLNCAIGCYTHAIDTSQRRPGELEQTLALMQDVKYLSLTEIPTIPRLRQAPTFVAYAPIDVALFEPDVVLIAAKPVQAMQVYEASLKVGAATTVSSVLGRPGCAVLPQSLESGSPAMSFGCIGNRTFTDLPDDELYISIPGSKWPAVAAHVQEVAQANAAMQQHYQEHRSQF